MCIQLPFFHWTFVCLIVNHRSPHPDWLYTRAQLYEANSASCRCCINHSVSGAFEKSSAPYFTTHKTVYNICRVYIPVPVWQLLQQSQLLTCAHVCLSLRLIWVLTFACVLVKHKLGQLDLRPTDRVFPAPTSLWAPCIFLTQWRWGKLSWKVSIEWWITAPFN